MLCRANCRVLLVSPQSIRDTLLYKILFNFNRFKNAFAVFWRLPHLSLLASPGGSYTTRICNDSKRQGMFFGQVYPPTDLSIFILLFFEMA